MARAGWRREALILAAGVLAWGALFQAEMRAAVDVWWHSTAFGHCFLIAPIAAFLAWERRDRLAALAPAPWPAATLAILPAALLWLAAERLGIMELRQFAALGMAWVLVLAVLGVPATRAMAVPLGYTVFLVPSGAFLVPLLQRVTARFIDVGLVVLDIPHAVSATVIEIPEGFFRVAEACAGLRFLIAAIAFGVLYACVIYRSPWRRLAFIAVSLVVPVLANGVRALGIVVLGHLKGSAEAGAVDHVLYGWLFFSLVILLLMALGLPFRDMPPVSAPARNRPAPDRAQDRAQDGRRAGLAACAAALAVLLAAIGPAAALWLDRRAWAEGPPVADTSPLLPAACETLADDGTLSCGGIVLHAVALRFGRHAGPSTVLAALRAATGEGAAEDTDIQPLTVAGVTWRLVSTREPDAVAVAALWLDGRPAPSGVWLRLALARASVFGAAGPARLVAARVRPAPDRAAALAALRDFAAAQAMVAAHSLGRPHSVEQVSRQQNHADPESD